MANLAGPLQALGGLRYHLIRTPLERPLLALRDAAARLRRLRRPALGEIYAEPARIRAVLRRALRPDSHCVDVGAHYGSTLSALLRLAPEGRHIAVEPMAEKAEFVRRKFPEVQVYGLALSDRAGTCEFFVNRERTAYSGLARHGRPGDRYERIEVPCDTLDHVLANVPRVDFLKLDVEGAEELVLRGGRHCLSKHRPLILFECGPSGAACHGRTPADAYRLLTQELGYDVYFLADWLNDAPPVALATFESALVYPFRAFNWVARARSG